MVERPREILVGAQIPRFQQLGSLKIWGKIFHVNFTIVAGNVRDVSLYLILQFLGPRGPLIEPLSVHPSTRPVHPSTRNNFS